MSAIILIKLAIYFHDHTPMFFLEDSASYISTAFYGTIPPDRSFAYGFLIKLVTIFTNSINSLILMQVLLSASSTIFLVYVLINFCAVSQKIASLLGILCALEPLQLLYERHVLTECSALFFLSLYVVLALHYLKETKLILIAWVQVVGVILISLRLGYLPIVLLNTTLLPILALYPITKNTAVLQQPIPEVVPRSLGHGKGRQTLSKILVLHLLVSGGVSYTLHTAYKTINGHLSNAPPAYSYWSGFVELAFWAPLVKPIDFPRQELVDKIFAGTTIPLDINKRHQRYGHFAREGGIPNQIRLAVGDTAKAEQLAGQTAKNIFMRDPLGVISLYFLTYSDYWRIKYLKKMMILDREPHPLPATFAYELQKNLNLDARNFPLLQTITTRYYFKAWPWYLFLLCSPALAVLTFFCLRYVFANGAILILIISIFLVLSACHLAVVRYLHPLGWFVFLLLGPIIDHMNNAYLSSAFYFKCKRIV